MDIREYWENFYLVCIVLLAVLVLWCQIESDSHVSSCHKAGEGQARLGVLLRIYYKGLMCSLFCYRLHSWCLCEMIICNVQVNVHVSLINMLLSQFVTQLKTIRRWCANYNDLSPGTARLSAFDTVLLHILHVDFAATTIANDSFWASQLFSTGVFYGLCEFNGYLQNIEVFVFLEKLIALNHANQKIQDIFL